MITVLVTLCQRSRSVRDTIRVVLPDGSYEALVVDAHVDDDGIVRVEVTITTGDHKGAVVDLVGRFPGRDELDLLAAPATLIVSGGEPRLTLDA